VKPQQPVWTLERLRQAFALHALLIEAALTVPK
jgi:hypothetical protein